MSDVAYTEFRQRLASYLDKVWKSRAPLRVTRQNAKPVIVLAEDEYDSMIETLHLLKSPTNSQRLMRSVRSADAGKLTERDVE